MLGRSDATASQRWLRFGRLRPGPRLVCGRRRGACERAFDGAPCESIRRHVDVQAAALLRLVETTPPSTLVPTTAPSPGDVRHPRRQSLVRDMQKVEIITTRTFRRHHVRSFEGAAAFNQDISVRSVRQERRRRRASTNRSAASTIAWIRPRRAEWHQPRRQSANPESSELPPPDEQSETRAAEKAEAAETVELRGIAVLVPLQAGRRAHRAYSHAVAEAEEASTEQLPPPPARRTEPEPAAKAEETYNQIAAWYNESENAALRARWGAYPEPEEFQTWPGFVCGGRKPIPRPRSRSEQNRVPVPLVPYPTSLFVRCSFVRSFVPRRSLKARPRSRLV